MRRKVTVVALVIALLTIAFGAQAEVYKWTDDKGTIHFTDDYSHIPEKYVPLAETRRFPEEVPLTAGERELAPAPKDSEPQGRETPRLFSGLISAVDHLEKSITVSGEGREMIFSISEGTRIMTYYGQNVLLGQLRIGRSATIEYLENFGVLQALSVRVDILLAATPNAVENTPGPGQLENPGKTQEGVWSDQQSHQKFSDGTPTRPPQFKLPKQSLKK